LRASDYFFQLPPQLMAMASAMFTISAALNGFSALFVIDHASYCQ